MAIFDIDISFYRAPLRCGGMFGLDLRYGLWKTIVGLFTGFRTIAGFRKSQIGDHVKTQYLALKLADI